MLLPRQRCLNRVWGGNALEQTRASFRRALNNKASVLAWPKGCQRTPGLGELSFAPLLFEFMDFETNMDTLAEWPRRRPAKPMGSPCVGSNPTGVVFRGTYARHQCKRPCLAEAILTR